MTDPTNGTSKETLKMVVKIAGAVLMVFVALSGFLATKIIFGVPESSAPVEVNVQLLQMYDQQVKTTAKLAAAIERGARAQENIATLLESLSGDMATKKDLQGTEHRLNGEIRMGRTSTNKSREK